MKKHLIFSLLLVFSCMIAYSQVTVSGSNGKDGTYTSLTKTGGVFAALNSLTQAGKTITVTITADVTTEDGTNYLTGAAGMWTSLTMLPTGHRTISGSSGPGGLFEINGAKYITINGRNDGTNSLIIENTSTGGPTIRLLNGATNNTVTNTTVNGCSTGWGVIFFLELTNTAVSSGNSVTNCDIGPSGSNHPKSGIYSFSSSAALYNNGVTISGNKIHDFISAGSDGFGILIDGFSGSNWTISGNSIYLTSAVRATSGTTQGGIYINTTYSNNMAVTGNYIGGSGPSCAGTMVDTSYNQSFTFSGIFFNVGTVTASSAEGNFISNILFKAKTSAFYGIYTTGGLVNIGETSGNTISGISVVSPTQPGIYGSIIGIRDLSSSFTTIANNLISGIGIQSVSGTGVSFQGIYSNGPCTISANTIGSATSNNITSDQILGQLIGIYTEGGSVTTVTGNIVRNFQHTGAMTGTGVSSSVIGMRLAATGSGQTVSNNSVSNLSNTNGSAAVVVMSIYYAGPASGTNKIYNNQVFNNTSTSTSPTAAVYGLYIDGGTATYYNNSVSLGFPANNIIEGIYENGATGNNSIWFNSVNIYGTAPAGASANTYAMYSYANTNTRNFRNNIFLNSRSNTSGAAKHFAVSLGGNTGTTIDYNDYYAPGTGGVLGNIAGVDKTTLAAWKTATGQDLHSQNVTAPFISSDNLHIPVGIATTLSGGATPVSGITTDYDGQTRNVTIPDIGADEFSNLLFAITVSGSNGKDGNYSSLTKASGAFSALNALTQAGKTITVTINGDVTTEDGANALTGAAGLWNTLTVIPVGDRSITGSASGQGLIDLFGAKYVKINGRNDGINSLRIENTNSGGATIRFFTDALTDTVINCTVNGCSSSWGVIFFHNVLIPGGNTYNAILNCDIGPSGSNHPYCGIYSYCASTSFNNNGVTISGNHIHDFIASGSNGYGVFVDLNAGSNWSVTNNSFYLTSPVSATSGKIHAAIKMGNTAGNNFSVTGNYIGGSLPNCGGSAMVDTSYSQDVVLYGIVFNTKPTTASSAEGNVIQNIQFRAKNSAFFGISIDGGLVNIGETTGNTISNITLLSSSQGSGTAVGIRDLSSSFSTIANNLISGIGIQSVSGTGASFQGIYSNGPCTISANTIGSATSNNITSDQILGQLTGIYTEGGSVTTVTGNIVRNFQHTGAMTGTGVSSSVIGMRLAATGSGQTVNSNSVSNLSNTNGSAAVVVMSIYYAGPASGTNKIYNNQVFNNTSTSTSPTAAVYGLYIDGGTASYYNNSVSLGFPANNIIEGIYENGTTGNNSIWFNSVNIYGTAPASASANTYAMYSYANTNTRNFRNNIFLNSRSNTSGTAKHFAVSLGGNTGTTIDYNDYYAPGTGGVLGSFAGTDKTTLAAWQTATGQDFHSMNVTAPYSSASDLHIAINTVTPLAYGGTSISGITTDIDNDSRKTPSPDIGSDEFYFNPATVLVSGSNGKDGPYTSLTKAGGVFAALNSLTQAGKTITVTISADVTTEDGANALTGAAGLWTSMKIVPSGNRILSGSASGKGLIDLSGAKYLTIDGINNGTNSLSIENTNTGGATIRFYTGASSDTVMNCTVNGCSSSWGVIFFHNVQSTAGNSNDAVLNCDIGPSGSNRPYCGIYSFGASSAYNNDGVSISGNHIHDFIAPGSSGFGVWVDGNGGSNWSVSNNSFYLTAPVSATTAAWHDAIKMGNPSGNNFSVTDNYIGGSLPNCGGSAWVDTSYNQDVLFYGITFSSGTVTASSAEGNFISNILFRAKNSSFFGMSIDNGLVNIGDLSGNTISNITLLSSSQGGGSAAGIRDYSTSACLIQNNSISGINVQSSSGTGTGFNGIYCVGPVTVSNNTIGSSSPNSITSDQLNAVLTGITVGGAYAATIQSNIIRNLQYTGAYTGSGQYASVSGIKMLASANGQTVTGNSIYNLSSLHSTVAVTVNGIYYSGPATGTNVVSGNLVQALTTASSNTSAGVYGLYINGGSTSYYNNMIALGTGITTNNLIVGIYEYGTAGNNNNLWFNSVNIAGNAPAASSAYTYALFNSVNTNARNFRNNLFVNARSNVSGSAKHYAVSLAGNTGLTIDYNDYYVSGTGGILGRYAGVDKSTLSAWQSATGQDVNSKNVTAPFISATDLHIPVGTLTTLADAATAISGITTDYDGQNRDATTPDIGADEFASSVFSVLVTGSNGRDGNYTSLTKAGGAFAALNGITQAGESITINICKDVTTEDGANILTGAAGMWNSLTIIPVGNRSITGSASGQGLIDFLGAKYVKIDGRNDGINSLRIENTNSGGATIRFFTGASSDTVINCTLNGCSAPFGVIFFHNVQSTGGNTNDAILNCDIGPSGSNRPYCGIYSYGANSGFNNNGVTISGNHIHDFIASGNNGYGVYVDGNAGSNWSVTNNSFYLTSPVSATSGTYHAAIKMGNPAGNNFSVTGNYIGGSAPNCGGTAWVDTSYTQPVFLYGILFNSGTSSASSAEGNIIQNILFRARNSAFYGISIEGGLVNIGETTGNTISNITILSSSQGSGSAIGIRDLSSSFSTISNNSISGITVQSLNGTGTSFNGIYCSGPAIISNNTIGSLSANNITSDQAAGQLTGIFTATGISTSVQSNVVRNFRHTGAKTGNGTSTSVIGMRLEATGAGQTISGNSIYNLASMHSSAAIVVHGIYYSGPVAGSNVISGNNIQSLSASASNTVAALFGIYFYSGNSTFSNNMVTLGPGDSGDHLLEGIYINAMAGASNFYFNSVMISGTAPSSANDNSFVCYNDILNVNRVFKNNIFINSRNNTSGTAKHYAMSLPGSSFLTIDYNDYFVSGTGGVLGSFAGTDKTTLADWRLATGQDVHSQNVTAPFLTATDLHILPGTSTTLASGAVSGTGITTDYDGETRDATNPDIGADEFKTLSASWTGATNTDWNTTTNWSPSVIPDSRTIVTIPNVTNKPVISISGNKCFNITIQSNSSLQVNPGKTLTVNGKMTVNP